MFSNAANMGNCLSSLSTPICQRTPTQQAPSVSSLQLAAAIAANANALTSLTPHNVQNPQQPQIFQFPSSGVGALTALTFQMLNSPNLHSPAAFNGALLTPSMHGKLNRSPDSLKTPIASSIHPISFQDQFSELANLKKG